jgi:F0F1-type ATP synthase membrane subunit b/b'
MRGFFVWVIDRWLIYRDWRANRRDTIASLRATIEALREESRRQREDFESSLTLRDREIQQLIEINTRDRERVRAEAAIHVANREAAGMRSMH